MRHEFDLTLSQTPLGLSDRARGGVCLQGRQEIVRDLRSEIRSGNLNLRSIQWALAKTPKPALDDIEGLYLNAVALSLFHQNQPALQAVNLAATQADALGIDDRSIRPSILVLLGNCHVNAIRTWLQVSPEIRRNWLVVRIDEATKAVPEAVARRTDCFVYAHGLFHDKRIAKTKGWLPSGCQYISFPHIAHSLFWPFYFFNTKPGKIYRHEDSFVIRKLADGGSPKDIARQYLDLNFGDHIDLDRHKAIEIAKQYRKEENASIRIVDWMIEAMSDRQLFYCPQHPAPEFFLRLVELLLEKLSIKAPARELLMAVHNRIPQDELPIHPQIIEKYRLSYLSDSPRFKVRNKLQLQEMEFAEFIELYAAGELNG